MKLGIIGGTFDPVHFGHLLLAERFREKFELDKIIFIPTGTSYYKKNRGVSDAWTRYESLKMALKDNEYFFISDIEIKREGNTYTVDTIRELKRIYNNHEIYFMTGTDILFSIEEWKEIDWVFQNVKFLIALREGNDLEEIERKLSQLINNHGANMVLEKFDLVNISSSMIREKVREDKSIKYLLPKEVEEYIREKGLYKA